MKSLCILAASFLIALTPSLSVAEDEIRWLLQYDGKALPAVPWAAVGKPNTKLEAGGLRLKDADKDFAHYRAVWKPQVDAEIIVEATVKVFETTAGVKGKTSLWPWRDGAPVSVLVSDGKHQEGLVLFANQAASHTDRFIPMDTTDKAHTYRLVIRGNDMQMFVDGHLKVEGQGAFWKPADSPEAFIQFGSSAQTATGEALWESVKLGIRQTTAALPQSSVKIALGEAWDISRDDIRQTRPYVYDMGQGLLLMSVAQGPDAFYEPYGLLKSTDAGKTWKPIPGLDKLDTTPLPCLRRPGGEILAVSRWTRLHADGRVVGKTVHLNADATSFEMIDNEIILPKEFTNEAKDDQIICERHIWNDSDGGATMVVWSRKNVKLPDGRNNTVRMSHLLRSMDEGKTWNYFSTIGPGGEPAVCRLSDTEQIAVIRGDRNNRMKQMFSHDGGRTWTKPVELEVGRVLPDLCLLSNGVLACSYGRPASCLMFSLDGGKSWPSHYVISEKVGFNYTSIREISPGRLLYIHDAPTLNGLFIDVKVSAEPPSAGMFPQSWQERAAAHAGILSRVKWSPVADTLPDRQGGFFEKGKEYTGVPYSSVRSEGRYIGFDIALRTFLAAVENPRSVLYTESLAGKVPNAAAFYGSVCSAYTSYALGCGIPEVSRRYGPQISPGIVLVKPQAAQAVQVGDVIYTPHATESSGSHVELVTAINRDKEGRVSSIRVEESRPPTTRITDRSVAKFDAHLASRNKQLFRVTDLDAWRGENRAELLRYPNFELDAIPPKINRALLLDLGDWVPYQKGNPIKFNVMDRDHRGVKALVIQRGSQIVEEVLLSGPGQYQRRLDVCGDYTAYVIHNDGTASQRCEFAVCDLDLRLPDGHLTLDKEWNVEFKAENINIIAVHLWNSDDSYGRHSIFLTPEQRANAALTVPAGLVKKPGKLQVWLLGEHQLGRLKVRKDIQLLK